MNRNISILSAILLSFLSQCGHAEIYRYQDANGDWHFTDKANGKSSPSKIVDKPKAKSRKKTTDLASKLENKYKPVTAIQRSTLSVVKVTTNMGSGSGFFISENGFLITNKHVIRPAKFSKPSSDKTFAKSEQRFQQQKLRNINYRKRLKSRKASLDNAQARLKLYSGEVYATEKRNYQESLAVYRKDKRTFERNDRELKQKYREFEREKNQRELDYANSNLARHFKIYLKDGTALTAYLVKMSDKHDLALLKVDDYKTPYLTFSKTSNARQGDSAYAIGSPLGMDDHMTSGIVTSLRKYRLVTDAKIFPGNSGGPLINEQGKVLGVNTLKMVRHGKTALGEGFGIAITKAAIEEEFASAIEAKMPKDLEKPSNAAEQDTVVSAEEEAAERMKQEIMKQYRQEQ